MPETVTALLPAIVWAAPAAGPVSVSAPVPPARAAMLVNVALPLTVPAPLPVIAIALLPSVSVSVSALPPPLIEPLKVVAPAPNVKPHCLCVLPWYCSSLLWLTGRSPLLLIYPACCRRMHNAAVADTDGAPLPVTRDRATIRRSTAFL